MGLVQVLLIILFGFRLEKLYNGTASYTFHSLIQVVVIALLTQVVGDGMTSKTDQVWETTGKLRGVGDNGYRNNPSYIMLE